MRLLQKVGIDMDLCEVEWSWTCKKKASEWKVSTVQIGKSTDFEMMMLTWCFIASAPHEANESGNVKRT